jgi:hypothetical protein
MRPSMRLISTILPLPSGATPTERRLAYALHWNALAALPRSQWSRRRAMRALQARQ